MLQSQLGLCQWSRVGWPTPRLAAKTLQQRCSSPILPSYSLIRLSKMISQAFLVAISQSAALMQRKGPQFLIRMAHTFQPYTPEEEKGRSCLSRTAAPLLTPLKVPHFFQKFPTLLIHRNHLWHRTGRTMYPVMAVLFNHLQSHCWCTLPNH